MNPIRPKLPIYNHMRTFHGEIHYGDERAMTLIGVNSDRDWAEFAEGEVIAASSKTNCYRVAMGDETVYVKRYVYTSSNKIRHWCLPSKPMTEVFGFQQLQRLDIPTLDVLAYGERRVLGSLRAAYIVTRAVPDSMSLEDFVRTKWVDFPEEEKRRSFQKIRQQLLNQIRLTHGAHFYHHDLKWRNILVHKNNDQCELVWIDCPRARFSWIAPRREAIVDLSSLARSAIIYLSVYDGYRFLKDYLGPNATHKQTTKLLRDVWKHLSRRLPKEYLAKLDKQHENTTS